MAGGEPFLKHINALKELDHINDKEDISKLTSTNSGPLPLLCMLDRMLNSSVY